MPIVVGGIPSADALSDSKVNLANKCNPVDATYAGTIESGSITSSIWTKTVIDDSNDIIYPTNYSNGRLALGYTSFSGSERLRVSGNILTTSITSTTATTGTLSLQGGSYAASISGSFTASRSITVQDVAGILALTSDIHTFANEALLDTYTNTNADISTAIAYTHEHDNIDALDVITDSGDGSTFLDNSATYRTIDYSDIDNTPTEMTPSDHTHPVDDIDEFNISSPQDDDILRYDSGTSRWVNETISVDWSELTNIPSTFTPGTHTHTIADDITDVNLTSVTDGDILIYDTDEWINQELHIFTNESILDQVTQDVIDNEHTHANQSVLDNVVQAVIDNSHTHSNQTLLDSITDGGGGTNFLADDGTYKAVSVSIGGSDTQVIYNNSGVSDGDSTFTFDDSTKVVEANIFQANTALYVEDSSTMITQDGGGNLVFTDAVSGANTLASIIAGATNYWATITGGIYYTSYVGVNNPASLTAPLTVEGNINADDFDSDYFRYNSSNLLLGPNAGDDETGSGRLYIHNSDTSTPLIYGEFSAELLRFYADVYIPSGYSLNFGSATNAVYKYTGGDQLVFEDGTANGGDPIFLTELIDGTYNALVDDFDDLTTVQGITSADTAIWDVAAILQTGGSGDQYLANDGSYHSISGMGLSTHLYLHTEASDIGGYQKLLTSPANDSEDTDTAVVTSGTSPQTIEEFATEANYPGLTSIPAGLWTFRTWLAVDNATGTTTVDIEVYKRDTGASETLLFSVTTPEINATSATQYIVESSQSAHSLAATDRIVVKYIANTDTGTSITVTLHYEGTSHYSYMIVPIVSSNLIVNDDIFDWDTTNEYYTPYADKAAAGGAASDGKFYLGSTDPDDTTRLNYDGDFHATTLESVSDITSGNDVDVTNDLSVGNDASVTGLIEFTQGEYIYHRQTLGTDTDGDVRVYSDASGYYVERRESSTWVSKWDITF